MAALILEILLYAAGSYLTFYSLYWLMLSIASSFNKKSKKQNSYTDSKVEYLILIPAYKPNKQLVKVLKSIELLKLNVKIKTYVLFQEANQEIVNTIKQNFDCLVDENSFKKSKGNPYHHALKFALKKINIFIKHGFINPSHVLLLDKDNIIDHNFFNNAVNYLDNGYDIVQGKRLPLNTNTVSESYDSIAEALNDKMFRKAKFNLGLTPEISGSATVYSLKAFSFVIDNLDFKAPGLDKLLMISLLTSKEKYKVAYQPKSIVYEEKTSSISALNTQRKRWFAEQYFNALYNSHKLLYEGIMKLNWSAIDYWITLWRPPRSFHLLISNILFCTQIIFSQLFYYQNPILKIFGCNFLLLTLAISIFLFQTKYWKLVFKTASFIPLFAIKNIIHALNGVSKKNEGKFIHTEHKIGN